MAVHKLGFNYGMLELGFNDALTEVHGSVTSRGESIPQNKIKMSVKKNKTHKSPKRAAIKLGWVPWLTSNPEPEDHKFFIPFRADILSFSIAPFDIVGKIGNRLWGQFLSEVAAVGKYNDRFDVVFDHPDSTFCLGLHLCLCICAIPCILDDAEYYPPKFFRKWLPIFGEHKIRAELYFRPGHRFHAMRERNVALTQKFLGVMLICEPEDFYLSLEAFTAKAKLISKMKQRGFMSVPSVVDAEVEEEEDDSEEEMPEFISLYKRFLRYVFKKSDQKSSAAAVNESPLADGQEEDSISSGSELDGEPPINMAPVPDEEKIDRSCDSADRDPPSIIPCPKDTSIVQLTNVQEPSTNISGDGSVVQVSFINDDLIPNGSECGSNVERTVRHDQRHPSISSAVSANSDQSSLLSLFNVWNSDKPAMETHTEVYEIEIQGEQCFAENEVDGFIYSRVSDEPGEKIGQYIQGVPHFYD